MKTEFAAQNAFNNMSVRVINRVRVLQLLFEEGSMTQLDIKNRLRLSGPTVTQTLQFFREAGLFKEGEEIESSGGRKPHPVEFCYDAFHVAGVEIRRHHVDIRIIDLKGNLAVGKVLRLDFENTASYWQEVNRRVHELQSSCKKIRRMLGVGIAFPGEISPAGDTVSRSTVLGVKNLPLNLIEENFDYLVHVEYGANAAGFGTVWRTPKLQNAVYIIVTDNGVAGSVILDDKIYHGQSGRPGAFGHIVLNPDGKQCFCGGRGCWSAYCSLANLTGKEDPDLQTFFQALKAGDPSCCARWKEYLDHFAQALANIRLSFDTDIIIGGKLAPYLEPWVEELKRLVSEYPALAEDPLEVRLDTESESPMADGAALMLVASFLNNTLEGYHFEDL